MAALLTVPMLAAEVTPRIRLEEFRIEPLELRLGESFTIHARAVTTGTKLGSFLLRTASEVKKADAPPGFTLQSGGLAYFPEDDKQYLKDNGQCDRDLREGALALEVNTRGWRPGRHVFAFFASNRPAPCKVTRTTTFCPAVTCAGSAAKAVMSRLMPAAVSPKSSMVTRSP